MAMTFRKFAIVWLICGSIFSGLMFLDALVETTTYNGYDPLTPIYSLIGWTTIATIPIAYSKYRDSRRKEIGKIQ